MFHLSVEIPPSDDAIEGGSKETTRLKVGSIEHVHKKGWSGHDLLDALIRIDYQVMDGMNVHQEGVAEQWAPVFMDHPDTWRLLLNRDGGIVGYWHFVPLFSEYFTLAEEGKLLDSEITSDKVPHFELPGWYDIYFVVVATLPEYRNCTSTKMLFSSLQDVIVKLAEHDIFIRNLSANAYTPMGVSLCKTLELKFVRKHQDRGDIYAAPFDLVLNNSVFRRNRKLLEIYRKAWHEQGIEDSSIS